MAAGARRAKCHNSREVPFPGIDPSLGRVDSEKTFILAHEESFTVMTRKIQFDELCRLLEGMEFKKNTQPTHVLFDHPATNSMVVFRPYRSRDVVDPLDLAAVRKTLDERGLMPANSFEQFMRKRPA